MVSYKSNGTAEVKKVFAKERDYSTLVGKVKGALFECSSFFEKMKLEKMNARASVNRSLAYFFIIVLVYLVVASVVYAVAPKPKTQALPVSLAIAIAATLGFAVSVIFLFVSSTLVHATARMLKGRGTYPETLIVVSFGSTPAYLLGWIPLLGLLAIVYGVFIQLKGIAIMHDLSQARAAASILVPLALMIIISILLLVSSGVDPLVTGAKVTTTATS
ncbi:YIP1 family protein [Candidatus Woesearchaeota archaeon]|nr:YIP1 family protein [Candidatus Woesearchaeota archaeon]